MIALPGASYLARRRGFAPLLLPLGLAFVALATANTDAVCGGSASMPLALAGFVGLFLWLRVVDDLDDFAPSPSPGYGRGDVVAVLTVGAALLGLLAAGLLWSGQVAAFILLVLAALSPVIGNHALKPLLTPAARQGSLTTGRMDANLLLAIVFEGTPLAIVAFGAVAAAGDRTFGHADAAWIVLLWLIFEVWKFSRFRDRPDWFPYGLSERALARCVAALALMANAAFVALSWETSAQSWVWAACVGALFIATASFLAPSSATGLRRRLPGAAWVLITLLLMIVLNASAYVERCRL